MSISLYLSSSRRRAELKMPKLRSLDYLRAGNPPIHSEDPVMSGEKSVEYEQRLDAIRAMSHLGESYRSVDDYDSVLLAHCRLLPSGKKLKNMNEPGK
jgi:hypothetical protein